MMSSPAIQITAVDSTRMTHTAAEHWPFFWSLFGLVGAIILIVLARFLGFLGIMTREDYYDD